MSKTTVYIPLKHCKIELKKIFNLLVKLNEKKLFIHENKRLNTKSEKEIKNLEEKLLLNENFLRDLKIKILSLKTEIEFINNELREEAANIIQSYVRFYNLSSKVIINNDETTTFDIIKKYMIKKNFIENTKNYKDYVMKLELELIKNNETLKGYSHKIKMQKNTIIKKKINRLNYSKIKRENENLSYVIHINNYKRIIKENYILYDIILSKLTSLDRMEMNGYINTLKNKKSKYCTIQLENLLKNILLKSVYNKDTFMSFIDNE